jgi:hypothetical protein
MITKIDRCALIAFGIITITACAPQKTASTSTGTVNLAKASETKTIECEAAFAVGVEESEKATDGSAWTWLKAKDGTLTHFCQQQANGSIAAWDEASRENGATHSLTFFANGDAARFTLYKAGGSEQR